MTAVVQWRQKWHQQHVNKQRCKLRDVTSSPSHVSRHALLFSYIPNIKHWWVLSCNGSAKSILSSLCLSVSLPLSAIGVPELAVRGAHFESSARQIKIAEAGVWTSWQQFIWMFCQRGAALYEGRTHTNMTRLPPAHKYADTHTHMQQI